MTSGDSESKGWNGMTAKEIFETDKSLFDSFDFDKWNRYYKALNREIPVEQVKDKPFFLELTENEKICYLDDLEKLKEERKSFPQAGYELSLKDFD